jgi:Mrp family chromosome partitioning ATPase/capsular polysaccharide biosynthesis protein
VGRRIHRESERPLTFHEFLSILWRRKLTIAICTAVAIVAAFGYLHVKTATYQSSSLIQLNTTNQTTGQATSSVDFPDPVQLLGSTAVEYGAAQILHDPNVAAVTADVTGTVDPDTGALTIAADDSDPGRAEAVAKAYTNSFVLQMQNIANDEVNKINQNIANINAQIAALDSSAGGTTDPVIQSRIQGLSATLSALEAQVSAIQVGEPYATVQVSPSFPTAAIGLGKSKTLAIGFLAGLLVGCGAALVREQFDTRLRTSPDIAEVTSAPVLAELPQDADVRSGKVSIALVQAPQSRMAEAVRELRTSLRVVLDDAPCPAIMVTSPEAGDGKTFVAANLAAAWALSGSKIIVVSADFRRPRLEELFGLQSTGMPGLADLIKANWKKPEVEGRSSPVRSELPEGLAGLEIMRPPARELGSAEGRRLGATGPRPMQDRNRRADQSPADESSVSAFLVETGIWGLSLLPAGTHLDNPSELFGSPGMQPVFDQLALLADIVLFDTPPVLAAPDAAIIGGLSHGAVVVASEAKTDRNDLERTVNRLESTHCRVLGVAVNRARKTSVDSYQYYTYRDK